jgi:hypothetical protein
MSATVVDYSGNGDTGDTPLKPMQTVTMTGQRTQAEDVRALVESDLKGNCYLTDTKPLLDKLFPLEEEGAVIKKVYAQVCQDKKYDQKKRLWVGLPKEAKRESSYYDPFVDATKAIMDAYRFLYPSRQGTEGYHCMWLNRANQSPESPDNLAPLIRPDIVNLLAMDDQAEKWEEFIKSQSAEKVKIV